MKKRKKWPLFICLAVTINLLIIVGAVCAFPSICLHFSDANFVVEGLDNYNPALSHFSIANYLMAEDGYDTQTVHFKDKYEWTDSYFRYETNCYNGHYQDTIILSFTYNDAIYTHAFEYINSQPGVLQETIFEYLGYSFKVNKSESIIRQKKTDKYLESVNKKPKSIVPFTNYDVDDENPYLNWIQLFGYSKSINKIIFIGFFYEIEKRSSFWGYSYEYYHFSGWNEFMNDKFAFYDWN